jgi:hypothetical protein
MLESPLKGLYGVKVMTWGTEQNNTNGMIHQLKGLVSNQNPDHAALSLTIPATEESKKLIQKYCFDPNKPLGNEIPVEAQSIKVYKSGIDENGKPYQTNEVIAEEKVYTIYFSWFPSSGALFRLNKNLGIDEDDERLGLDKPIKEQWRVFLDLEERYTNSLLGRKKITMGASSVVHLRNLNNNEDADIIQLNNQLSLLSIRKDAVNVLLEKLKHKQQNKDDKPIKLSDTEELILKRLKLDKHNDLKNVNLNHLTTNDIFKITHLLKTEEYMIEEEFDKIFQEIEDLNTGSVKELMVAHLNKKEEYEQQKAELMAEKEYLEDLYKKVVLADVEMEPLDEQELKDKIIKLDEDLDTLDRQAIEWENAFKIEYDNIRMKTSPTVEIENLKNRLQDYDDEYQKVDSILQALKNNKNNFFEKLDFNNPDSTNLAAKGYLPFDAVMFLNHMDQVDPSLEWRNEKDRNVIIGMIENDLKLNVLDQAQELKEALIKARTEKFINFVDQSSYGNYITKGESPDNLITLPLNQALFEQGRLEGLDVENMLKEMRKIVDSRKSFNLNSYNCSNTVSEILAAGASKVKKDNIFKDRALFRYATPHQVKNNCFNYLRSLSTSKRSEKQVASESPEVTTKKITSEVIIHSKNFYNALNAFNKVLMDSDKEVPVFDESTMNMILKHFRRYEPDLTELIKTKSFNNQALYEKNAHEFIDKFKLNTTKMNSLISDKLLFENVSNKAIARVQQIHKPKGSDAQDHSQAVDEGQIFDHLDQAISNFQINLKSHLNDVQSKLEKQRKSRFITHGFKKSFNSSYAVKLEKALLVLSDANAALKDISTRFKHHEYTNEEALQLLKLVHNQIIEGTKTYHIHEKDIDANLNSILTPMRIAYSEIEKEIKRSPSSN